MKKNLFLGSFVLSFLLAYGIGQVNSQTNVIDGKPAPNNDWLEMIQDPDVDFYEVQSVFNKYWENRTDYKGNGYKIFKRWEYINESRVLPDGKLQTPGYIFKEYNKYMSKAGKSASGDWSIQGPTAYVGNNTGQPTGMGRINAIAFHPTVVNTIFVGSPSGGFWKSTTGGNTWTNLSNDLPTLGVSCILVHPTDPDIIYIGGGDRDSDDAEPMGVFKSTNGGANWVQINNTMGNVIVGAMVMHPSDPNTIIAATSGGIYKSTNGGTSWTAKLSPGNFKDIKFKPGNPSIVYAIYTSSSFGAKFYRSDDTGEGWTHITAGIPNGGTSAAGARMVIGVSANDPTYVYLVQIKESDKTLQALLRSTDSGLNFATRSTGPNILGYNCDGSGTASQATYDLCITVDPSNANIIYVGGLNNWKSTDGGITWSIVSHWIGSNFSEPCAASVHADQHCYEWNDGKLYVGHDGGINYSADGGTTWPEITGNLAITQIYKIGQGTSNTEYTLFGCQDNGSSATTNGSTFTTTRGGDGMECIIDYNNSDYCYNTYIYGSINRSTTGPTGSYSSFAADGVNGIDESGAWVTPYILHNTDPNTMFIGYKNVWRSNNVHSSPPTWTKISTGETSNCSVLEQSPANVDILYVVRSGAMQRTENANATAGSVSWTACALPGGGTPTDVKAHPTNANIVFATKGYNVYRSADKGVTWTDISSNLPSLFINCLVLDKNADEGIYIGNQTSVWYKNATMTDWMLYSEGLPPVDIRELEIFYDPVGTQNRIKAGTYGRGLWQSDLIESGVLNPTSFAAEPVNIDQIDLTWALNPSSNNVLLAYSTSSTFGTPVNGTSYSAGNTLPSGGGTVLYNGSAASFDHTSLATNTQYFYKLWSYDGSTEYSGGTTANATTFCALVNSFPWNEGFENAGSIPDCWTQEYESGTNDWQFATSGVSSHPATAHTGTYLALFRYVTYGNENFQTKLVSPPINLSLVSNPVLSFWHTQELWGSNQDELRVYYRTSTMASWTLLTEYTSSIASWTKETISLPNSSATYFVAFEGKEVGGYGVCLDDIEIGVQNPTNFEAQAVNIDQINLDWTLNSLGDNVVLAYNTSSTFGSPVNSTSYPAASSIPGGGTALYNGNATSFIHSSLTTNTPYYYKLWSYDGATQYSSGVTDNATTFCTLVSSFPWTEGFEHAGSMPDCWTQEYENGTNPWEMQTAGTNGFPASAHTGSYLGRNRTTLVNAGYITKFVTPPLKIILISDPQLKFWHTQDTWSGRQDELRVYYRTASNGTWNLLATYTNSIASWTEETISLPSPSATYFIAFESKVNAGYGICIDDIQVSGTYLPFWTGIVSTDWNTAGNWLNGSVPTGSSDVTIPNESNDPIINQAPGSPATCNDLIIQSGASLTINPGKALTVSGDVTNEAGTSGLVVKSDATGTGSIIHSTANVDATYERYMNDADWANWQDGWHFLSSPVVSQAISPAFVTDPATDYDFYCWYEPENLWVNFKNTTTAPTWNTANGSTNFTLGKGYMTAYDAESTKEFTGKLNVDDVNISGLTITGTTQTYRSWHLLGNPFGSALAWDNTWTKTGIAGVAKIWNESNQSYSDLTSDPASVIPATNGFFVQVTSDPGSLTIPESKRVHSAQAFYKSTMPELMLKAINLTTGNIQESRFIINPVASLAYDPAYDCEFLPGYAAQFYSIAGIEKLSTNSFADLNPSTEILFGFIKNEGNDFQIEASGVASLSLDAYLHDLKTSTVTHLNQNPTYQFTAYNGDITNRFMLKFVAPIPVGIPEIQVYVNDDALTLMNMNGNVRVEIFAMSGQSLLIVNTSETSIPVHLAPGIYMVRITSKENARNFKVFVK